MGRNNSSGKLSKKVKEFPQIFIDKKNDFASIKLASGIEFKSYEKDGFIFCENKLGRIIEVQLVNLSQLAKLLKKVS